ncbi:VOC family protein [Melittangium boletus]|uniref:VOC family protein n=1 Tax=Melittangium boletus TaxID=83453 RepID=UPI003DA1EEA6
MISIRPHLWYSEKAEEAARLYVSLIPNSRINHITKMPGESPSGPPGSVTIVDFVLAGQPYLAMTAGPMEPFNHAVSFVLTCDDQAEVDRLWDALSEGGTPERCGWLRDRYGVCWQIVPNALGRLMGDPDRVRAGRVAQAMLKMVKLDIAGLQAAYDAA